MHTPTFSFLLQLLFFFKGFSLFDFFYKKDESDVLSARSYTSTREPVGAPVPGNTALSPYCTVAIAGRFESYLVLPCNAADAALLRN